MENKSLSGCYYPKNPRLKQFFRIMRITTFLLVVCIFSSYAATTLSQNARVTINKNKTSLYEVLQEIESQTDYLFVYNNQVDVSHKVSLKTKDTPVANVLSNLFRDTDIEYSMEGAHIILSKRNEPIVQQASRGVTGKVTDSTGEGIIGATVQVKGNNSLGTITDADGNYSLNGLPANAILRFSYIGMQPQEIAVEGQSVINVVLTEDSEQIEEVVVTAMGIQRDRKSLGYAISTIKASELTVAGVAQNPVMSLYGKAPGVAIRQSVSGPLGGINIQIRGAAGLEKNANTRPLFVVDGVPIFDENTKVGGDYTYDYGTGINDINSEDIESIEILKGAKASVLYGSEGANGVVLITTKSGTGAPNRTNVNVSFQMSNEKPVSYIEFQNKYGSGASIYDVKDILSGESYPRFNSNARSYGPAFDASQQRIWWDGIARPYVAQPNNYEFLFEDGSNYETNVSVDRNGDFGNVRLSYTNTRYNGIIENMNQWKNSFSLSSNIKFSKKLSVETVANLYSIRTKNRTPTMLTYFVNGISRDAPFEEFVNTKDYLYTDPSDRNYGYKKAFDEAGYPTGYYSLSNYADFAWNRDNNRAYDDKLHLIASVRPTYRLTDQISVIGQASLDYTDTDFTTKNNVTKIYPDLVGGRYAFQRRNTKIQEYKGFVNYVNSFMNDEISVTGLIGVSYKNVSENRIGVSTANVGSSSDFIFPNWWYLSNQNTNGWPNVNEADKVRTNSYGENSLYGLFGVATMSWREFTLELNARNDWSSTLPPEHNSYFYPGVALTWDATNLIKRVVPVLEFGKLRASWADVGRDASSRYFAYNSLESNVIEGTDAQSVSAKNSLFSGTIKPERKREWEFGLELNFFKGNRLRFDGSFYINSVYDQIMSVPLSQATGATEIKINAGQVDNWGYEILVGGTPILTKDFRWDLTFTTANQYTEVVKLYPGITKKIINDMTGKVRMMSIEGERHGNLYGTALKLDPNGNRIVSENGSQYILDETSETKIGNVFPNFMGGFSTNFNWKGINVYAHFDYSFGSSMYSQTNQWLYYNGASVQSLKYRDEANGGLAYYIDDATGNRTAWQHNQPAPASARDGRVYHDGIILKGVQELKDANGNVTGYKENDVISPVSAYYGTFVSWAGESINAVDLKYKNNYIKLRELAVSYTFPEKIVKPMKLRSLTLGAFGRNLFYVYKSVPNLDPESFMGTNDYFEGSPFPSIRTMGFKVNIGF